MTVIALIPNLFKDRVTVCIDYFFLHVLISLRSSLLLVKCRSGTCARQHANMGAAPLHLVTIQMAAQLEMKRGDGGTLQSLNDCLTRHGTSPPPPTRLVHYELLFDLSTSVPTQTRSGKSKLVPLCSRVGRRSAGPRRPCTTCEWRLANGRHRDRPPSTQQSI